MLVYFPPPRSKLGLQSVFGDTQLNGLVAAAQTARQGARDELRRKYDRIYGEMRTATSNAREAGGNLQSYFSTNRLRKLTVVF